jgi:threonine/homoserine/homoserine lactone efflux protein
MSIVFEGIPAGLLIGLSFGPAFFMMMQTTMANGVRPGMMAGLGIVLSDLVMFLLSAFSLTGFMQETSSMIYFGLGGGLLLIVMGIISYFRPHAQTGSVRSRSLPTHQVFGKAFVINTINPFNWLFWIMLSGIGGSAHPFGSNGYVLFFTGLFITEIFLTVIKVFLSERIGRLMNTGSFVIYNKAVAIVFVISGLGLIVRVLFV